MQISKMSWVPAVITESTTNRQKVCVPNGRIRRRPWICFSVCMLSVLPWKLTRCLDAGVCSVLKSAWFMWRAPTSGRDRSLAYLLQKSPDCRSCNEVGTQRSRWKKTHRVKPWWIRHGPNTDLLQLQTYLMRVSSDSKNKSLNTILTRTISVCMTFRVFLACSWKCKKEKHKKCGVTLLHWISEMEILGACSNKKYIL